MPLRGQGPTAGAVAPGRLRAAASPDARPKSAEIAWKILEKFGTIGIPWIFHAARCCREGAWRRRPPTPGWVKDAHPRCDHAPDEKRHGSGVRGETEDHRRGARLRLAEGSLRRTGRRRMRLPVNPWSGLGRMFAPGSISGRSVGLLGSLRWALSIFSAWFSNWPLHCPLLSGHHHRRSSQGIDPAQA
jgi:hypothetical protein